MRARLVLDTNIWLDWLVFDDPSVVHLRAAIAAGRAQAVIDAAGEAELARVLGYPLGRFTLDEVGQAACLARCRSVALRLDGSGAPAAASVQLPKCSDPDDQKFLELAAACGAAFVVTKDRALLELAGRELPFRIVAPGALDAVLGG